ncbi:MAG: hypothetical protein WD872_06605 [Pirellulaceae bacterium]
MRISFTAEAGSFDAGVDALVCSVSGGDRWIIFQRTATDSPDDFGIHLEFGDRDHSGYGCVAACRLSPDLLAVDLARPLGRLADVTGFDVALQLQPETASALRQGLRQIFRGLQEQLTVREE